VRLARQHNLRQQEACSARPKPHSPLNPLSVVELALLEPPEPPPDQGLVRLASNNHSSSSSSSSNNNSNSRLGPGSVRLVKLNHNNRPASAPADSVLPSRSSNSSNNNPVVSSVQVPMLSVKNLLGAGSVWALRFKFTPATDTSKVQQPQVLVLLVPVPVSSVRRSLRPPLPLVLLPNNLRQVLLAQGDSVPVSLEVRPVAIDLTGTP